MSLEIVFVLVIGVSGADVIRCRSVGRLLCTVAAGGGRGGVRCFVGVGVNNSK